MKAKIDWSTVEILGPLVPLERRTRRPRLTAAASASTSSTSRTASTRGNGSIVKLLLSGGSSRARSRGAIHTHVQLKRLLPPGPEMLVYSWSLVAALLWKDHEGVTHSVELVARAIRAASDRLAQLSGPRPGE